MSTDPNPSLNKAQCTDLLYQLLAGQDWILADPTQLTAEIWQETAEPRTADRIRLALFRRYAALLHYYCYDGKTAESERAWHELRLWLAKQARHHESHPATREEIVQETLLALQSAQPQTPNAFLAYALQTMKRQQIDLNRRRTAEKRGSGQTLSLETLNNEAEAEDGHSWDETLARETSGRTAVSADGANWRTIENAVSDQEIRHQLLQFAQQHLPTDLQEQVFEAHFLDGLSPAEIARQLGKKSHEIRLIKARIVKKMKTLPPEAKQQLAEIVGRLAPNE